MEIVTTWMEKGEKSLVMRLLKRRLGGVSESLETAINSLPIE